MTKYLGILSRRIRKAYRKWHRIDLRLRNALRAKKDRKLLCDLRLSDTSPLNLEFNVNRNDWPLVSVRIPTFNRAELLIERSVKSVLGQTYQNFEIVIVGDGCTDQTAEALASVEDKRIRFLNLAKRGIYPSNPEFRWLVAGLDPANRTIRESRGEWMAPLDDDDEFTDDHIEVLLDACKKNCWEFVYGVMQMEKHTDVWEPLGSWPPRCGSICHGSVLYNSGLRIFEYEADSWKIFEPADWNLWRRMAKAKVKMGFVNHIVGFHYREMNNAGLFDVRKG